MPVRIQRSRLTKQKSPNGLPIKYVGRPSEWGNPFRATVFGIEVQDYFDKDHWVKVCMGGIEACLSFYTMLVTGKAKHINGIEFKAESMKHILPWIKHFEKLNMKDLKGKNLSCWCDLKEKCHVDILLQLAN